MKKLTKYIEINNVKENNAKDSKILCMKIEQCLKTHRTRAYLVQGLMADALGVEEKEMQGRSFSDWGKCKLSIFKDRPLPTIYGKVRSCLDKLVADGKVAMRKDSNKIYFNWIGE